MATTSMLKAKGLHTFNNYLSSIPEGSQLVADNVIIDKDGVLEPRRGITQYGEIGTLSNDIAKQLLLYKDRVLAHYKSTIAWDNGSGTFTDFSGLFDETEVGLRIKSIEANSNLYLTTAEGIKKIAAVTAADFPSAQVGQAGPIKAVTGTGECDYTQPVFPGYSKVAYRITWATTDVNGNLIEGAPSPAIEIINQSPDFCAFRLRFQVPNGITTDYFYRIYRTQIVTAPDFAGISDLETGDEMRLVIEDAYVGGTEVVVVDTTPDTFRDQNINLYTNEFSGEGILQANEAPPFAKDIVMYQNAVFYSNTRLKHRFLLNLLGISDLQSFGGVQDSIDIIAINYTAPDTTITFSADPEIAVGQQIVILGSGSPTLDGVHTVTAVAGNDVTVVADGTGASVTDVSVYGSYITIASGTDSNTYFFVGRPEITDVEFPAQAALTDGGYFIMHSFENLNKYVVWYDKTGSTNAPNGPDTVGSIKIRVDVSAAVTTAEEVAEATLNAIDDNSFDFITAQTLDVVRIINANSGTSIDMAEGAVPAGIVSFTKIQDGQGEDTALGYARLSTFISPAQNIDDTARSLVKVINANPDEVVNAYYIFKPNDVPGQMLFEAKTLSTQGFTVVASSAEVGALFNPNITIAQSSNNEPGSNRIYYSKIDQPENVPIVNYIQVGPRDKQIKRVLALQASLFILKEEGIYRLTGDNPTNYFVSLFDNSAILLAPDTACVLNNQIYCLSTQGIISITEAGVKVVSRPIENIITRITSPAFTNYKTISFGMSYESERSYFVWIPEDDFNTTAKVCMRYNTFTNTWTSWSVPATCAIVEPIVTNKLYKGADDDNLVEIERKELNRNDYADRQYVLTLGPDAFETPTRLEVPSTALMDEGDATRQIQYVTIAQVERLARKFYLDSGVPYTIDNVNKLYYKNYALGVGVNLQQELSALITQLNADTGGGFNTTYSVDFETFQDEFNALVGALNTSPILNYTNYQESVGTVLYELLIRKIIDSNTIEVLATAPYITGPFTLYKAIPSEVVWAPLFFGEPSIMKHTRESTIMFDVSTLAFAKLQFNTDLSPNYEGVDFLMEGDGSWGVFFFNSTTWGGEGTNRPFRTGIPRQKQRNRFIRSRFTHNTALYRYGILGIAFTYEVNSERAYR